MMEDALGPDGLICSRCGAEFTDEIDFRAHVSSHVTGEATAEFVCTLCGESYQSEAELDAHAEVHSEASEAA